MGALRQVATVLWKNVWIQGIRRHYVRTGIQLAVAVLLFYTGDSAYQSSGPLRYAAAIKYTPRSPLLKENAAVDLQYSHVVYGPPSDHTRFLVDAAFKHKNETTLVNSSAEVMGACAWVHCFCFYVHSSPDAADLNYTFYFRFNEYHSLSGEKFELSNAPPHEGPLQSDIATFQATLEDAHLAWVLGGHTNVVANASGTPTVLTKQLPRPSTPEEQQFYRSALAILLALAFIPAFCIHVYNIVAENASGIKEMVGIMGLDEMAYWLGHLCTSLMMNIIPCIAIFYLFVFYKSPTTGYIAFHNADPFLVGFVLLMFCFMTTMHTLLVACIFKKTSMAVTFAVIYWIVLMFIVPWLQTERSSFSLSSYLYAPRMRKLLTSATPCLGTYWVLKILAIACDVQGGARWNLVTKRVLSADNVTILEIWTVMAATFAVIAVLAWYLSRVLPWVTGIPQPFYFPLLLSYWRPHETLQSTPVSTGNRDNNRFEEGPENLAVVVNIVGLRKDFGTFTALDSIDLKFYKGEITALLGHNGAGKTTLMNILTGFLPPTEGTAIVCGHDIVKRTARARKNISLCPQFDIFFTDLTVWEHLAFFGTLKGLPASTLNARIDEVLNLVNLTDKRDNITAQLSGGMKRRLSIAIATVSSPQVIILDEPSSGMDPETRREIWDLFLGMRNKCSLVLSTHDMEEADVLGDRIAILSQGKLCCFGTPVFLKKKFGAGYELTFQKAKAGLQKDKVLALLRQTAPEAEIVGESLTDIKVLLGVKDIAGFPRMFAKLEKESAALGIANIGVSVSTMEDVYIKVNLELGHEAGAAEVVVNEQHVQRVSSLKQRRPNPAQRLRALLTKRCIYFTRVWSTPLIAGLVPLLIFWGAFKLEYATFTDLKETIKSRGAEFRFKLSDIYPSAGAFLQYDHEDEEFAVKHYRPLIESEASLVTVFRDADAQLLQKASASLEDYVDTYVLGASAEGNNTFYAWWSPYYTFSRVLSLNLINTALLRFYAKDPKARMSLGVRLNISSTKKEQQQFSTAASTFLFTIIIRLVYRALFLPLGCSFIVAAPVLLPVTERMSLTKHLQLMSGISSALFWLSNFFFDTVTSTLTWIAVGCFYEYYFPILPVTAVAGLLWAVACSFMMSNLAYCLSLVVDSPAGGFTTLLLIIFFGGAVSIIVVLLGRGLQLFPNIVVITLSVLPPFLASYTLMKLLEMDTNIRQCAAHVGEKKAIGSFLLQVCSVPVIPDLSPGMKHCCKEYFAGKPKEDVVPSPFLFTDEGIMYDVMIMFAEGLLAYAVVCIMDSGTVTRSRTSTSDEAHDDDVEAERVLVEDLCTKRVFSAYSLVVHNIQKVYGQFVAVKGISFTVRPKECFGLLGVNGAGKTTTFQILTSVIQPSAGEAYMKDLVMTKNNRKWQSNIGYCPQMEGLLGKLDTYQSLYLYARLRGVPEEHIPSLVDSMVEVVDLNQHAQKVCESYSGGNKRKLSMAISMIGLPGLVFLDEPTAGVDVVARRKIFSAIHRIKTASGIAIILTSHSMDECEAACERIAIMVDGQFQCLGPLQHLKAKFGRGCSLTLKMASKDESEKDAVQAAVTDQFPGIQLKEYHQGVFEFQMDSRMKWSKLFDRISSLQKQFRFEQVNVSDTTLEQIFIGFAKRNRSLPGGGTESSDTKMPA